MDDAAGWERWSALFADLDGQFAAEQGLLAAEELAQRLRHEAGRRTLVERLRAAVGYTVRVGLAGCEPLTVVVREVGPDWLLGEEAAAPRCECLLHLGAVRWIEGLGRYVDAAEPGRVWTALDLRKVLRGLAQRRVSVSVAIVDFGWEQGTFDRVYADHVEIALHQAGEPRRARSLTAVRAVPLTAISAVRRLA